MEVIIAQSALDQKKYEISIQNGEIQSISTTKKVTETPYTIGPGFIDIQVNGYAGIDYNMIYEDFLTLGQASKELLQVGVCEHFPTVITNSKSKIGKLFQQIVNLIESNSKYKNCIPGFHLEGPFISPENGPRGAHFKEFVCTPNWDDFQFWQEKAHGNIKLITLSPEWEGSNSFIEKCVRSGVKVSIGHTNASPSQILEAVLAGASLSTHLGNGAHGVLPRHPNYLWSQLAEKDLSASMIADGFHLPKEVIQVFHQVKKEQLFMVSDSVALAGMPPGDYNAPVGGLVTLSPQGKLHLRNQPNTLAGSAMNLLQGVNFLLKNNLATLSEAWEMASIRPKQYIYNNHEKWSPLKDGDLIIAKRTDNSEITVDRTFKKGIQAFPKTL